MKFLDKLKKVFNWKKIIIALGLLIIILTGVTQYSDSKINDYNKELFIKQGKINNILLHRLEAQSSMNRFELYEILQPNVALPKINILFNLNLTGERYNELHRKFKSEEITKAEFLTQMKYLYADEYDEFFIQYHNEWQEVEEMYSEGTPWSIVKNIAVIIQMISAVFITIIPILKIKK